jgi:hypothetical protein
MLGRFGHYPRRHSAAVEQAPGDAARGSAAVIGLGRSGPPAWPDSFEDVIGFAFSPDEYTAQLRGHGFDVIADTITGHFVTRPLAKTASTTGSAVHDDAGSAAADTCQAPTTQSNWPEVRIEQLMQLNSAQHDALNKLQAAVNQSAKTIGSDCLDSAAQAPPDRLRALIQGLWSARDGGIAVRGSLKNFLDTLDDAQKARFASQRPQATQAVDANTANSAMNKQYQACARPNIEASERMIKEIELRVRPTKEQTASLEGLHKTSSDMAKLLMASCAKAVPDDPLSRIDDAGDQLTAMNYAAATVQIALDDFYGKLDSGQKARLEANGR